MQQVVEDAPRRLGLVAIVGRGRRARGSGAVAVAPSGRIAHAQGELAQLLLVVGQPVRLQVEQQLQTVLGLAQEAVGIVEDAVLLVGEAAGALQGLQGQQRVALAHLGQVAAVEELQELDGELDVADAAAAGLDLGGADAALAGLLLDAPFQRLDLVDLGERQIFAVDERLDGLEEALAQGEVAGRRADLDERLPLPGAAEGVVVGQGAGQRPGQRAAVALRPQAQVDAVGQAAVGVGRQQAHHLADDLGEELVVADAGDALAAGGAVLLVDEHQVDVAAVVQLLAAELAEGEDDAGDGPAGRGAGLAVALADVAQGGGQGDLQGHVGGARDVAGDLFERPVADDVVGADAEELPLAEAAKDAQDGRVLVGGVHLGLELGLHLGRAGAAPQRHAQHVEVVGVGGEQVAERLADAEQLQQDFQGAGAVFEQQRQQLGAGRLGEEALQVVQRHVGVGAARQQPAEGRAEVAQAVGRQGGGDARQVAAAALGVAQVAADQQGAGAVGRVQGGAELVELHKEAGRRGVRVLSGPGPRICPPRFPSSWRGREYISGNASFFPSRKRERRMLLRRSRFRLENAAAAFHAIVNPIRREPAGSSNSTSLSTPTCSFVTTGAEPA